MEENNLRELLGAYGIDVGEAECGQLLTHLRLVIEKNRVTNLTRIETLEDGLVLHVLDSLLPLPHLVALLGSSMRDASKTRFVDVGTGGGFPGIPVGIVTGWEGILVDSVGKKVAAAQGFIHDLALDNQLAAEHIRVEDLARSQGGSYDVAFFRAVAQTNVLLEYGSPLLRRGGYLVAYKGSPSPDELIAAQGAAELVGMRLVSRETFELPHGKGHREVLIYQKVRVPRIRLPRQNGMAKREPLGVSMHQGS